MKKNTNMKAIALCACMMAMSASAYTQSDMLDIAATIWDEARGESFEGRQYVASVIWNRGNGNASKMVAAVKKRKQFSGWKNGVRPSVVLKNKTDESIWKECQSFAKAMLNGSFTPATTATHYHNTSVHPQWADELKLVKIVGRHKFYV